MAKFPIFFLMLTTAYCASVNKRQVDGTDPYSYRYGNFGTDDERYWKQRQQMERDRELAREYEEIEDALRYLFRKVKTDGYQDGNKYYEERLKDPYPYTSTTVMDRQWVREEQVTTQRPRQMQTDEIQQKAREEVMKENQREERDKYAQKLVEAVDDDEDPLEELESFFMLKKREVDENDNQENSDIEKKDENPQEEQTKNVVDEAEKSSSDVADKNTETQPNMNPVTLFYWTPTSTHFLYPVRHFQYPVIYFK